MPGHQLRRGDQTVRLEHKVMQVLAYLAQRPGTVVSREELADNVWSGVVVGDDAVTNAVIKLRRAFGDSSREAKIIETVPKSGYRLTAPVEPMSEDAASEADEGLPQQTAAGAVRDTQTFTPVIAVFPFTNRSGDPDQDYFSEGIAEDLITALARVHTFRVLAQNITFHYKGDMRDVREVGRELGAGYVIDGSVRRSGNRIRVSAALFDAMTGSNIWTDHYDGEPDDIFEFQDQITRSIAGVIEPHLSQVEMSRILHKRPENLGAYDYLLRGFYHMNKLTPEDTEIAKDCFLKAVELDGNFARACSFASWSLRRRVQVGGMVLSDSERSEAVRLANESIRLDNSDPVILWQAAMTFALVDRDFEHALDLVERSLQLDPHSTRAWKARSCIRSYMGDFEGAIEDADRALELIATDRSVWVAYSNKAIGHFQASRYEDCVQWARRAIAENVLHNAPVCHVLAASLAKLGRLDEAKQVVDTCKAHDPELNLERLELLFPVSRYSNFDALREGLRSAGLT